MSRGNGSSARISPVVARIASEHHVDLALIHGTGEGGRVTKKDILAYVVPLAQRERRRPVRAEPEKLEAWEQPGLGELFRPTEEVFGKARAGFAQPDRSGGRFRANGYVR